jgi:hypothetical protein
MTTATNETSNSRPHRQLGMRGTPKFFTYEVIDARFSELQDRGDTKEDQIMSSLRSSSFLRRVLLVDAVSNGAMGFGLILAPSFLAEILQLPASLLTQAGIVLIPFAAFVGFLALRERPAGFAVWSVIGLNVLWTVDSILVLATGWVAPNALGYVFIVGQALTVAVLAELEYVGLRRSVVVA